MAYILVVDGDGATRTVVRTLLEEAGHAVGEAQNGRDGLASMGRRVPDLVITEVYLEGMEGIEFLRAVRETWPSEPVLVMSSKARPGALAVFHVVDLLGVSGLLDKPIVRHQLIEAVREILVA